MNRAPDSHQKEDEKKTMATFFFIVFGWALSREKSFHPHRSKRSQRFNNTNLSFIYSAMICRYFWYFFFSLYKCIYVNSIFRWDFPHSCAVRLKAEREIVVNVKYMVGMRLCVFILYVWAQNTYFFLSYFLWFNLKSHYFQRYVIVSYPSSNCWNSVALFFFACGSFQLSN